MKLQGIILTNRDSKQDYYFDSIVEDNFIASKTRILCYLINAKDQREKITLNLFSILNSLNTPNGAWSIKMPEDQKFIYDTEVWVKGKILSECENNCDIIEIDEVGHPRQLAIRRFNQIKKRVLQG